MRWPLLLAIVALVGLALACGEEEEETTATPPGTATPTPAALKEHSLGSAEAPLTIIEYSDFQ